VKVYLLVIISFFSLISFSQKLIVDTVCFNTPFDDYGVRKVENELFMVSASNPKGDGKSLMDEVLSIPYSDVFKIQACDLTEAMLLSKEYKALTTINSVMHDGPISSNAKGDMLFFSNNSNSKESKLGIFYMFSEGGEWLPPLAYPLNSDLFNVTHPFFDDATNRLYFASDFKNGKHIYDIYYSDFNGKDWGRPIAVDAVNSDSTEFFPVLYNSKLYFTSNNSTTKGGLDLFVLDSGIVRNLGDGFNSEFDDLALLMLSDTTGYFSSSRSSNGKQDDVFSFHYEPIPVVVAEVIYEIVETPIIADRIPEGIIFAFDKFSILPNQKYKLDTLLLILKENPSLFVIAEGHTDAIGSSAYNMELSKKRAVTVRKYLIANGISVNRILVENYGLSKPVDSNATPEGRGKNRRVDFRLVEELEK
jgi:outer membrane protein OmpA-like peptidoglycan-associated protein